MARTCSELYPEQYPRLSSPSGRYYVQQTVTWQGDSVVWWSPDRCGYTFRLDKAGVYEEEEARAIEGIRGEDYAVPVEIAQAAASRHVAGQDLSAAIRKGIELGAVDAVPLTHVSEKQNAGDTHASGEEGPPK